MALFTANGLLMGDTRGGMRGIQSWPRFYVAMSYQDCLRTQEISYEESRKLPHNIMEGWSSWLGDVPELYSRRAPGNTCLSALKRQKSDENVGCVEKPQNNSKGCGGIMRIAPLALNYHNMDMVIIEMADDLCHGCQMSEYGHYEDSDWIRKYIDMQWKDERLEAAGKTQ